MEELLGVGSSRMVVGMETEVSWSSLRSLDNLKLAWYIYRVTTHERINCKSLP